MRQPLRPQISVSDHQRRHAEQEQRDRGLHPMDRRVKVMADAADRDVHVGACETGDELSQRKRGEHPA
jgi:hypothetical protein